MSPSPIRLGLIDPQGGGASGLSIVSRGFDNSGEFFFENVFAPAGSLLVVYLVLFSDGSLIPDSNIQLDGVDMVRSPFIDGWFDSSRTVLTQVYTKAAGAGISGATATLFESEPGLQAFAWFFFTVEGGAPALSYITSGDDSNYLPRPGPVSCLIHVPNGSTSILMLCDFQLNNVVGGDAYDGNGVLLREEHLAGGVDTGMMSFGVFANPTTGFQSIGRALHNPPRPYFGHAMCFGTP